jgi:hypothetical protein
MHYSYWSSIRCIDTRYTDVNTLQNIQMFRSTYILLKQIYFAMETKVRDKMSEGINACALRYLRPY